MMPNQRRLICPVREAVIAFPRPLRPKHSPAQAQHFSRLEILGIRLTGVHRDHLCEKMWLGLKKSQGFAPTPRAAVEQCHQPRYAHGVGREFSMSCLVDRQIVARQSFSKGSCLLQRKA